MLVFMLVTDIILILVAGYSWLIWNDRRNDMTRCVHMCSKAAQIGLKQVLIELNSRTLASFWLIAHLSCLLRFL